MPPTYPIQPKGPCNCPLSGLIQLLARFWGGMLNGLGKHRLGVFKFLSGTDWQQLEHMLCEINQDTKTGSLNSNP